MINAVIPQQGLKPEELQKVKTVAVIAFDVLEFRPTGIAGALVGGSAASHLATAQTGMNIKEERSELAEDLYAELTASLTKKGWQVLPAAKVASNPTYRKFFQTKKASLLEKSPNHFQKPVAVEGIMRPVNPHYMLKPEERTALAKALGVDALIFTRVAYHGQKRDYLGLGVAPIYLQPILKFNMYAAHGEDPIWFDNAFEGPRSATSIGKISGMEDVDKIAQFSRPLASQMYVEFLR